MPHRLARLVAKPSNYLSTRRARRHFESALSIRPRDDLEKLGSDYGGYAVPVDLLGPDSTCYSCGVGEDVTFDLALIARTGCRVHAFDPTPRAAAYASQISEREPLFSFHPYGVWRADETKRFYSPADDSHVSHSIGNLQGTHEYFDAECRSIPSLMAELGHSTLDLLKLDIEGAEYDVLENVLDTQVDVRVLCVEFHVATSTATMLDALRRIQEYGLIPAHAERLEATFVRTVTPTAPN